MKNYKAIVKRLSKNKYQARVILNGYQFRNGDVFTDENKARLDANYLLMFIEQVSNDWNGNHSTATYKYMQYKEL